MRVKLNFVKVNVNEMKLNEWSFVGAMNIEPEAEHRKTQHSCFVHSTVNASQDCAQKLD